MNQHESTILVDFPLLSRIFFMSWSPAWNPWRNNESIESLIQGGRAEIESKEVGLENSWPFSFSEGWWNFNQLSQKIPGISFQKIPFSKVRRCTRPFVGLQAYWRWLGPKVGSSELPGFSWVPSDGYRGLVYVEVHGSLIWTWWRLVSFHLSLEVFGAFFEYKVTMLMFTNCLAFVSPFHFFTTAGKSWTSKMDNILYRFGYFPEKPQVFLKIRWFFCDFYDLIFRGTSFVDARARFRFGAYGRVWEPNNSKHRAADENVGFFSGAPCLTLEIFGFFRFSVSNHLQGLLLLGVIHHYLGVLIW